MFSKATIENKIYEWITSVIVDRPFIWLDQNAPRPDKPYLGGRIMNTSQIGEDFIEPPDETTGKAGVVGNREFILTIENYGSESFERLDTLNTSLNFLSSRQKLLESGIAFVDREAILNTSLDIDTRFEERATMDLRFRIASIETDTLDIIETVEATKKINIGDETIKIIQETIG